LSAWFKNGSDLSTTGGVTGADPSGPNQDDGGVNAGVPAWEHGGGQAGVPGEAKGTMNQQQGEPHCYLPGPHNEPCHPKQFGCCHS